MRLDHLLSKEHHEKALAFRGGQAVKGWVAVVAPTGCAATIVFGRRQAKRQTHCWVLRQHLGAVAAWVAGSGVVAPSWWWGVVFGNWIVVASIR